MGRHSILPDKETIILAGVRNGLSLKSAAHKAGVSPRALFTWCSKGREDLLAGDDQTVYALFVQRLQCSMAGMEEECVSVLLQTIRGGTSQAWRASLAMLRSKFPHWRKPTPELPESSSSGPVVITSQMAATYSLEQRKEIYRRTRQQVGLPAEIHNQDDPIVDVDVWNAARIKEEEMGDIDLSDLE